MTAEFYDSVFHGVEYLVYPGPATVTAERNIFRDSTKFSFTGDSYSNPVFRYNCFNAPRPPEHVISRGSSYINFNSIHGVTAPITESAKRAGFQTMGGNIDASNNYWHGLSEADIRETILDSTVELSNVGIVEILPMLTQPHPDTPDCSQ